MVRLITVNGKSIPREIKKNDTDVDPVSILNDLCRKCFLRRRHYINFISDVEPFNKERARQIMTIMIAKGITDPTSFALGQALKLNWQKFEKLD